MSLGRESEGGFVHTIATSGRYRSWAASHCGTVRDHNEDTFVNRPDLGLWAVADGAGGHDAGEVAAGRIAQVLGDMPTGLSAGQIVAETRSRLQAAHAWLRTEAQRRGTGIVIASTAIIVLARNDYFACLWAGDSRAYLLRQKTLTQISRDHSLVQELVDCGALPEAEAEAHPHANVITRAVGADIEAFELDKRTGGLLAGDRILLCSDGLSKTLPHADIAGILGGDEDSPAERLVLAALAQGANDNVTAVTVEVLNAPMP